MPRLLRDRGAWRVAGVADGLSLRVLAPALVLGARRYWCPPTRLVIDVTDPTGVSGGRWAVHVEGRRADVVPTDEPADIALGSVALSAALLGGSIVGSPFHTPSVTGSDEAVSSFRALMSTPWDAHCDAHF
jgi:hypothetical protein